MVLHRMTDFWKKFLDVVAFILDFFLFSTMLNEKKMIDSWEGIVVLFFFVHSSKEKFDLVVN
jgi:hypothetical protein